MVQGHQNHSQVHLGSPQQQRWCLTEVPLRLEAASRICFLFRFYKTAEFQFTLKLQFKRKLDDQSEASAD